MKARASRFEFRAKLKGGATVEIPGELAAAFRLRTGDAVMVSVDARPGRIALRPYADEEVDRIAMMQMEPPDGVRKCLDAQGSLSRSPNFAHRPVGHLTGVRRTGRSG